MTEPGPEKLDELLELMRSTFPDANGDQPAPVDPDAIVFESLRAFLERDLPPAESLLGVSRNGTNLLPRYGWVMPWGPEGCGKTSILVDLLFHAAAGRDWLIYPCPRPLKVVCIVNEGIPGGLQDKLAQKVELWDATGDAGDVLDNLAIYVSPWGEFTFRDPVMVEHARSFAIGFGADYVALDPLHTLGSSGAGAPAETEEFKHMLRSFGVWEDLGVITAHHSNKQGMVSGDWGRHPDVLLHFEKDGKNPATKLTVQKARPADPAELHVPVMLNWLTESFSYERKELGVITPSIDVDYVVQAALDVLTDAGAPMALEPLVKDEKLGKGTLTAKREAIQRAVENGVIHNLASPKKPGGRQQWSLVPAANVAEPPTLPTLFEEDDPQTGMVEPSSNVGEAPTLADVSGDSPARAELTSNVGPPLGGATLLTLEKRAEDDARKPVDNSFDPFT